MIKRTSLRKEPRKCTVWMLLITLSCMGLYSHAAAQASRFSFAQYRDAAGDTLNYRILYPDADKLRTYPLVIFLHGSGERGNDNKAQLKWGVLNFATDRMMMEYPAIIVAPQCPPHMSWAHFSGFSGDGPLRLSAEPTMAMKLVIGLIHQLMAHAPVDTTRIYITGLSMGGLGTYDAIERYPNLFAAAIPVAGGGDPSKAGLIAHIPLWDFHGAEDPAVDPRYSREMMTALLKAGGHPGFTEYPGVGHFSWLGAYSDPTVLAWLFRQHK
ncbi:MAG TPA: prolyl oligopeptidase family serine peptidase [Chitinophagaceae bacterium]|nr:prolyl oligopeptidase family serine peptidase [Chitinophagaceae bacterium]